MMKKKKRKYPQSCWERNNRFGLWPDRVMEPRSFWKSLFRNLKTWPGFKKYWAPSRSHWLQYQQLQEHSISSRLLTISWSMCVTYKINGMG